MCASTCQRFYDKCVDILTIMNATNYLPNCEGLPETNCNAVPFSDQLPPGIDFFFFFLFSFFFFLFCF